jgi:hypothetical protein
MPKMYKYVGPAEILARRRSAPKGVSIKNSIDLRDWTKATVQGRASEVVATYVIDKDGNFLIADRRSEHVACAGGGLVRAAGEMTFNVDGDEISVIEVSNQSTGYCPEPESWPQVVVALDRIPLAHPGRFTLEIVFRRCNSCSQINVVKDNWFVCVFCGKELPTQWNVG